MMIISYAGNAPDVGVGVGGGVAILGGTFLVCGFVLLRLDRGRPRRTGAAGPAASGQPPLPPSAPNASGGPNTP
jgi:hypothetical protein